MTGLFITVRVPQLVTPCPKVVATPKSDEKQQAVKAAAFNNPPTVGNKSM